MPSLHDRYPNDTRLVELRSQLLNQSIKHRVDGSWMFDNREVVHSGKNIRLIAELIWENIKQYKPDCLFGKGVGSVGIMAAVQMLAAQENTNLITLLVRDKRKEYAGKKLVEGPIVTRELRGVYIDDLFNSGSTYRNTLHALDIEGYKVTPVAISCMVDLWRGQGTRQLEVQGLPIVRLYRRHDLGLTREEDLNKTSMITRRWVKTLLNTEITPDGGLIANTVYKSKPVIVGAYGYVGTDTGKFICFNINDGSTVWEHQTRYSVKGIASIPAIVEDRVIFGAYDGTLYCCDRYTGKVEWANTVDRFIHSSPLYVREHDMIVIGTENGISGDIVAVDLEKGYTLWRQQTDGMVPSTATFDAETDTIFIGSNDAHLYCLNAWDGSIEWYQPTRGEVKGQPIIFGENVIAGTGHDGLHWFNKRTGQEVYCKLVGRLHHCFPVLSEDGKLIIAGRKCVFAFDPVTAEILWMTECRQFLAYSVEKLPHNRLLITSAGKGQWLVLDGVSGRKIWTANNRPATRQPGTYADGMIYVATNSEGLQAFELGLEWL